MCGRLSVAIPATDLARAFPEASGEDALDALDLPRYNVAPTRPVPALVAGPDGPQWAVLDWWLTPRWAKERTNKYATFNARAETVATTNAFRVPFRRRRCLILADGFFEWWNVGKAKTPMRIVLQVREAFAFAGLWEQWTAPSGAPVHSCTIITTRPNSLLEPIHNRMPVMLTPRVESVWLDRSIEDPETLTRLLVPYPPSDMEAYEVSTLVNSPGLKRGYPRLKLTPKG